jgi:acyl-CoA hydrolase
VFVGSSYSGLFRPEHADAMRFCGFGGVGRTSELTKAGVLDVLPVHIGSLPELIAARRLPVDVVLVQLSSPDEQGRHSLGLVADYLQPAIATARTVVAEINPHCPFTYGDTLVPAERLGLVVHDDRPLLSIELQPPSPVEEAIASSVAALIPDGATIQFGVGRTPDAVLRKLVDKRDLGVHSGLISDALVDLIETGVVTNRRKPIDPSVTVTGALLGTDRLYRWADRNPDLAMRALSYTHDPRILAAFDHFYAINSALEVDLTGQINAETVGGRHLGTIGGQGAFARAALTSPGGRSIIALPSVARRGETTRIVANLPDRVVTTSRADADLIVTEHGVADLRGATISERRTRLIAIADPRHRDELERHREDRS